MRHCQLRGNEEATMPPYQPGTGTHHGSAVPPDIRGCTRRWWFGSACLLVSLVGGYEIETVVSFFVLVEMEQRCAKRRLLSAQENGTIPRQESRAHKFRARMYNYPIRRAKGQHTEQCRLPNKEQNSNADDEMRWLAYRHVRSIRKKASPSCEVVIFRRCMLPNGSFIIAYLPTIPCHYDLS